MDAQELRNLQEAYMEVYQELDEVVGRGKIDPIDPEDAGVSRETGARSPRQAGLRMPPLERAKLRSNALSKRSDPKAKKRGKDILTRFVNPTERGIDRAINTAGETTAAISQRRRERQSGNVHESYDIYDVILSHLLDEGYAETPEAAEAIMVNMSEEWRETILEAEVLAQKGGVPGTVNVNKTKEGGFFGIGSREVSKPVSGSFKEKDVSSKDAARYNTAVDRKFGSSDNIDSTPAANVQYAANRAGHSGYMKVNNPSSIPDTGIPNRPSPGRSFDQNQARTMSSDIVRMNKQR